LINQIRRRKTGIVSDQLAQIRHRDQLDTDETGSNILNYVTPARIELEMVQFLFYSSLGHDS
jgi:hypothetical protein